MSTTVLGVLCGAGAALFWAIGLVAARHGIQIGFSPSDISLHRYVWSAFLFLPLIATGHLTGPGAIGWGRSFTLTLFAGPLLSILSYAGFLLVPLGHGGLIQPSTAALVGLILASVVLKEKLPLTRAIGALTIVVGLAAIAAEALTTIGTHGLLGDLSFMAAGTCFAIFGMLLRLWRIQPTRGTVVVSILSLFYVPVHGLMFGFHSVIAAGWYENFIQAVVQGIFAGPLSIFLFARAVVLLGVSRAAVFPALVPPFTLLTGYLILGEVPSVVQLIGLAIVAVGFRLTQKS
jgi:drug/metabolite transporter (DMT)-like permease